MVMVLFAIAELIEAKSLDRARNAIRSLVQLAPDHATVREPDGSWVDRPAASVRIGDVVRDRARSEHCAGRHRHKRSFDDQPGGDHR
jgi:Cd2+/Zn2+-exporting ATPase